MPKNHPAFAPTVLIALALGLPACSSDDSTATMEKTDKTTTTAASGAMDETSTTAAGTDSMDESTTTAKSGDSDSGDMTNPGKETLVDGPGAADKTITFDGTAFSPATLKVAPGEVFTYAAGPDASPSAVTFNGSDTYTITSGLKESFTLETPGTYTVKEDITGATMTVTVG